MKTIFVLILLFIYSNLLANDGPIKVHLSELNSKRAAVIPLINKHILFIRPQGKFSITNISSKQTVSIFLDNKNYPFTTINDHSISVTAPVGQNLELQININNKDTVHLSFIMVTAIEDKNLKDGFILFNKIKHPIGLYPRIPSTPGKVNYFKKDYAPPKWFSLWNDEYLERPISRYLKYSDLVTAPKPLEKDSKRPTKIFTCSYKVMKEFDLLIDQSKSYAQFKKVRVLSFYRTPIYNKSLGTSRFSRHIYGDAIDFFIDEKTPWMVMDDLNHDKKKTVSDAKPFFLAYKNLISNHINPPGGMGIYFSKKGASIHYDSRGHLARWGAVDRWWPVKSLPKELKSLENKIKLLKERYEKKHSKKKR